MWHKIKLYLIYILIGITIASLLFSAAILFRIENRADNIARKIIIPKNSSAIAVADILKNEGVISNAFEFKIGAKFLGSTNNLQAGTYKLSPNMPLLKILSKIKNGEIINEPIKIIIPEGSSVYAISRILHDAGLDTDSTFYEKYIKSEGYLFPDTYIVSSTSSNDTIANLMIKRFQEIVIPVWQKSKKGKYSLAQVIILASIIEKEAHIPAERPVISSVFHNRLNLGMALAADPTIKYALENPKKKVYLKDLKVNSPYNTYNRKDLPPGPICNPGLQSIIAAIHPAKTNFYYFVSKGDGSHEFLKTFEEHKKAKQKYKKRPPRHVGGRGGLI